jgi:hypothetical protein
VRACASVCVEREKEQARAREREESERERESERNSTHLLELKHLKNPFKRKRKPMRPSLQPYTAFLFVEALWGHTIAFL